MNIRLRNFPFSKIISKWGLDSQYLMLIEEMNELSKAILHLFRKNKKGNEIEIIKEIVDVEITIECIKFNLLTNKKLREIYNKEFENKLLYINDLLVGD